MIPAFLTAVLWSLCVIPARVSVQMLGEHVANFWRLLLAAVTLGVVAHTLGWGIGGAGFLFFFVSGMVGFGFGDIGVFFALPRIGSRLTILMCQCLAVPIAGILEWQWMGTALRPTEILAVIIIVGGVVLGVFPERLPAKADQRALLLGIAAGLVAAVGQGGGALLSRAGYLRSLDGGLNTALSTEASILAGASTGYQRLLGGLLVVGVVWAIAAWRRGPGIAGIPAKSGASLDQKVLFVALNAFAGPVFGIICFQWALATTPSAIVQAIVATTPLIIMPLSYLLEGDRPSRRSIVGSVLAVAGVLLLGFA